MWFMIVGLPIALILFLGLISLVWSALGLPGFKWHRDGSLEPINQRPKGLGT